MSGAGSSLASLLTPATIGVATGAAGVLILLFLLRRRAPQSAPPKTEKGGAPTAAGHAGNIEVDGFFYKLETHRFENERTFLERTRELGDPLLNCMAEYHGVEERDGKRYLKMRSLVRDFDPASLCIMDVKMGVRCFAEKELKSDKPRPDLFKKLQKMGMPLTQAVLTPDELAAESITKARWMVMRDETSSTKELGFRVDGVVTPRRKRTPNNDLVTCRSDTRVVEALRSFLPPGRERAVTEVLLTRLAEIEACQRRSELFASSEVIGSSLLFAADDAGHVGVWMLDFGLTCPADVPSGRLAHTVPWELGNHEDGYLTGIGNLQRLWRRVLAEL